MALLPKLHVNRHTAHSIIFGPEKFGGLALPNLYVTNNIDKLKLFLGHLRIRDRTGKLIDIDMTYIQLLSGSGTLFLNQDAQQFRWLETGWLTSLWLFTSKHSLTFYYPNQWLPTLPKRNDRYLMEAFAQLHLPLSHMKALNRCRIFLQVITFSDIASPDGTRFLQSIKQGRQLKERTSILMWPAQGIPSKADWKIWSSSLASFETHGKLIQQLGQWEVSSHQIWHQVVDPTTGIVYDQAADPPLRYSPIVHTDCSLWSGQWYYFNRHQLYNHIPEGIIPVSITHRPVAAGAFFQIHSSQNSIPQSLPTQTHGRDEQ